MIVNLISPRRTTGTVSKVESVEMGSKVVVLTVMALILSECWTLPLTEKEKRESVNSDQNINSDGDETSEGTGNPELTSVPRSDVKGCFTYREEVWVVTV